MIHRNGHRNGDADIRALERVVEADPGDLHSYVRLLREKVRSGLLSYDRLVMAARLGSEAARGAAPEWVALGAIGLKNSNQRRIATDTIRDHREIVSFACDCVERVLPIYERIILGDTQPRRAVETVRAWIASPSEITASDACDVEDVLTSSYSYDDNEASENVRFAAWAVSRSVARVGYVNIAIEYALAAAIFDKCYDEGEKEALWQRLRLIQYLLGEVTLPSIENAARKNSSFMKRRNSDADIRSLERAVASDPSNFEAGARLIAAGIRVGLTTNSRVLMAARIGDEAARLAAPEWVRYNSINWTINWVGRYHAISKLSNRREIVSYACDCAERVLGVFERQYPDDMSPRKAIEAARAWVIDPSVKNKRAALAAEHDAGNSHTTADNDANHVAAYSALAAMNAAACVDDDQFSDSATSASESAGAAIAVYRDSDDPEAVYGDNSNPERLWQRQRLAKYLIGDVTLPPIKKTARKRPTKS